MTKRTGEVVVLKITRSLYAWIRLQDAAFRAGIAHLRMYASMAVKASRPCVGMRCWHRWIEDDDQWKGWIGFGLLEFAAGSMRPYLSLGMSRSASPYLVAYTRGHTVLACGRAYCRQGAYDMVNSFAQYQSTPGQAAIYWQPIEEDKIAEQIGRGDVGDLVYGRYYDEGTYFHRGRVWRAKFRPGDGEAGDDG